MLTPPWLETFPISLMRHGLPEAYALRISSELRDHAEDAGDADVIGDPDTLLKNAIQSYRHGRFAGRHPFWAMLVLPIVLVGVLGALLTIVGEVLLDLAALISGKYDSPGMVTLGLFLARLLGFAAPLLVLWWGHGCFQQSGRERRWFLGMAVLLTLMAGCILGDGNAATPTEISRLTIELIPPQTHWQFAQSVALLSCAGLLIVRQQRAFLAFSTRM